MNYLELIGFIQIVLIATTPVVFAGICELVTEKSGVLNLGVEGMMLVGAVTSFVTLVVTGNYFMAFLFSLEKRRNAPDPISTFITKLHATNCNKLFPFSTGAPTKS